MTAQGYVGTRVCGSSTFHTQALTNERIHYLNQFIQTTTRLPQHQTSSTFNNIQQQYLPWCQPQSPKKRTHTSTHSHSELQNLTPSSVSPLQFPQFRDSASLHGLINFSSRTYDIPEVVLPDVIEDTIQKASLEQEHGEYHRFHRTFVHKIHFQGLPPSEIPDHIDETGEQLEDIIKQVVNSVGQTSSRELVKCAFICLAWFGEELENTNGGVKFMELEETYGNYKIMEKLYEGLDATAELLEGKGGLTERERESDEMESIALFLEHIAMKEQYAEYAFMDIRRALWGELPSSDWSSSS
jgi:hypothetical protein